MLSWDEPISATPARPAPTRTPGLPADAASAPGLAEIALAPHGAAQHALVEGLRAAEVGDLAVIYQSGAYGASASPQAFLGHPVVTEVLV